MNNLQELLVENEEWLKKHVLEFAGQVDESLWPAFFSGMIDSAPPSARQENRLERMFHAAVLPILHLDSSHSITLMNPAAESVLGIKAPARLADVAPWLNHVVEKECPRSGRQSFIRFDATQPADDGEKHYAVTMSDDGDGGCVMVLDDITVRVETQRQLVRERNRASYYLDVVGSLVVVLDASGAVTMMNETGCRALGYELHELLGRNWVDTMVPEEQRDGVRDYLYLVLTQPEDVDGEYVNYITTKDGDDRLIQWQNSILKNEGGMPVGILCSGMDITEQQAVENALAEKELWLRSTFVALGEAVLILTPEWEVLDANPAAETMFGMTNEGLVGIPVEDVHVDAFHNQDYMARCQEAFDRGETAMFEFPLRRSNGQIFPSEQSASLIIGDDGRPLGIVNAIRDISSRKKAEQELRESEEKFRRIFESMEEGYIVAGLDGTIHMVNPATCKLLRYCSEDLVGTNIERVYYSEDEQSVLQQALASGEAVRGATLRAVRKDGAVITVDVNAHLVLDELGNPVAMEGTFRDISRRIEAEKVLREREQQYRAFFENNHAIMLLVDPKTGHVVDANPAASDFYGYEQDKLRSMNMDQINVLKEDEMFKEMELAREEKRAYFIVQHALSDGSVRDVEVYSGPIMVQGTQLLYSVIHDVTKRIRLESEMKTLATTDALTGANNRHQFFESGSRELRRAERYKKPLTLLMLDIDYFKSINDSYGHQAGDVVLQELSKSATTMLRESDVFGRLGGEEFAVVLPETGLKRGMEVADRLRQRLAEMVVKVDGKEISFTVSIGATLARRSDKVIEDVIKRADEALYKAKRMGRNRVERS